MSLTVAELLQQSRAAHEQYRQHLPKHNPTTKQNLPGDRAMAMAALRVAAAARAQAELQDPERKSADWRSDEASGFDHVQMCRFYLSELSK